MRVTSSALFLAVGLVLGFLLLPVVAIFVSAGPDALIAALGRDVVRDALLVTVKTSLIAQAFVVAIGTPAAYRIATGVPMRPVVVGLIELPLVMPPTVAGLGLLFTFGTQGILGGLVAAAGVQVVLTQVAVIMAVAFVSSPFYIRAAITAFESVDHSVVDAARTLGASPARVFRQVVVPLAAGGLATGATLAFARGVGEFGATIIVGGNIQRATQTLPLAIYDEYANDPPAALAIGAVLITFSLIVLIGSKLVPRWRL